MPADIRVQNEGTIVVLFGETETGRDWLEGNLDPTGMKWGDPGFVVEHRYVVPILEGATDEGLTLGGGRLG